MKKSFVISVLIVASLLVTSCIRYRYDDILLLSDTVSLRVGDEKVFVYDELNCQMSFNKIKKEFRVFTDNMSDYFTLTLSSLPSREGESVTGTVRWTTKDDVRELADLTFSLEKTDASGHLWLWNNDQRVFIVVLQL